MTITTGPRPMTDDEKEAWTLHLQKVPVPEIQTRTGLLPSQIAAAVDLGQVHARRPMESSTAVLLPAAPKPAAISAPVPTAPAPSSRERELPIGQLLAWADKSGHTRALTLAARIRTGIDELRAFHAQHDARAKAQAEVERLTAELEAAKAALREAGGRAHLPAARSTARPAGATPTPDRREYLAAIRAWAAERGTPVNGLGRIPKNIEADYNAAMAERERAAADSP